MKVNPGEGPNFRYSSSDRSVDLPSHFSPLFVVNSKFIVYLSLKERDNATS